MKRKTNVASGIMDRGRQTKDVPFFDTSLVSGFSKNRFHVSNSRTF